MTTRVISPLVRTNPTHFLFGALPPDALQALSKCFDVRNLWRAETPLGTQRRLFLSWAASLEVNEFGCLLKTGELRGTLFRVKVGSKASKEQQRGFDPVGDMHGQTFYSGGVHIPPSLPRRIAWQSPARVITPAEITAAFDAVGAVVTRLWESADWTQAELYNAMDEHLGAGVRGQSRVAFTKEITRRFYFDGWHAEGAWEPEQVLQTEAGREHARTGRVVAPTSVDWLLTKSREKIFRGIAKRLPEVPVAEVQAPVPATVPVHKESIAELRVRLAELKAARLRAEEEAIEARLALAEEHE